MDDIIERIKAIEESIVPLLQSASLSQLSERNVELSLLLGKLVELSNGLEELYLTTKSERYWENLKSMKSTPAKDVLDFDPDLIKMKLDVERVKDFIRTRERTILRIEHHLQTETKLGIRNG